MLFLRQNKCDVRADFACADNNNIHLFLRSPRCFANSAICYERPPFKPHESDTLEEEVSETVADCLNLIENFAFYFYVNHCELP